MLVIQMQGLPGSGKSTMARALAARIGAAVIDKDVIKAALLRSGVPEALAAPAAYEVYFEVAASFVASGQSVILDNPVFWPIVEQRWRALAREAGSPLLMIECVCPDAGELRRRLATRKALESQQRHVYPPGTEPGYAIDCDKLVLDTTRPLDELVEAAIDYVRAPAAAEATR